MSEYDDIKEALAELGDDSREVGVKLTDLGCTGYRGEGSECPVFKYLTDTKGIDGIERVVGDEVWVHDEPIESLQQLPDVRVPLPDSVRLFVREFDNGDWPELEERRPH